VDLRLHDPRYERADREGIRALQFDKLRALLEKTWAINPFYREHWQAAGVAPGDITSLEAYTAKLPHIRKRDLIADQDSDPPFGRRAARARAEGGQLMVFTTSGTTGQGVEVHAQTRAEWDRTSRVSDYLLRWGGLDPGDSIFLCFPITLLGGGRIELVGLENYGLTVYPVGNYDVARKLELMQRFQPQAIQATTSYLAHLAAVAGTMPPSPGLKALFGGGEGGGFAYLERLQAQWGVPLFNQFGATQTRVDHMFPCERGIGTREKPGMLHNIDPYFLVEVVDPETGKHVKDGEAGEIVVTSLIHDEIPLIRCAMSDRAVYRDPGYCDCGRPFCGVEAGTISRMDDMKKVKGINIWPQSVDDVMFGELEVDEYEIVLATDAGEADVATARVMPKSEIPADRQAALAARIADGLRRRIGITFAVEVVPRGSLQHSEYKARRWVDRRGREADGGGDA
jgi:phenylacetate-CoA ligase